jgi:hypothetical protein
VKTIDEIIDYEAEPAPRGADDGLEVWYRENVQNVVCEVLELVAQRADRYAQNGMALSGSDIRALVPKPS